MESYRIKAQSVLALFNLCQIETFEEPLLRDALFSASATQPNRAKVVTHFVCAVAEVHRRARAELPV